MSQPICKLVEGICADCGRIYEPIHVKRMAQARLGLNSSLESFLQIIRDVKKKKTDYVYAAHEVINADGNIVRFCLRDLFKI